MNKVKLFLLLIFLGMTPILMGQSPDFFIHPNVGQWDERILYNVELAHGNFYLDKEGYTIVLRDFEHHHGEVNNPSELSPREFYALKIKYIGGNKNATYSKSEPSPFYRNYFLGSDSTKWRSKVFGYQAVTRQDLYPGVDVETRSKNEALEINYHVAPHADAAKIVLEYEGFTSLEILKDGSLKMAHPIGYITESAPIAWTEDEHGNKTEVEVAYKLEGKRISFHFPNSYDTTQKLIIDPVLGFSTFTGATSDNWGFTAAPDAHGNAYGGGISFGNGYPTTTGALGPTYAGGHVDIGISKFSADGTQLLYSTYLGGTFSETPHSIISTANGDIYVFGITGSLNFPVTNNAYKTSYSGGNSFSANNINFNYGSDIFVAKFNATGTALLGSTYVGGVGNDGINLNTLNYNYGDQFRGDITLDKHGNIYVASTTYSSDFPNKNTGTSYGGMQDGVLFKMNSNLTDILWSTFVGGTGFDAAYSVQIANDESVFIAGGTTSVSMGFPSGIKTTTNGGLDGFIAKYNNSGQLQKGTYVGTPSYDQIYFLQLDLSQNIYVFGQTAGNMPKSQGKYGQSNSGQFVKKFDPTLSGEMWSTTIGTGNGVVNISPTAFLVSDCDDIYLAGWGGSVNKNYSQANQSTTIGMPITNDAYQSNTNGSNFYIAVLQPDATGLKYGTFIGGVNSSANHVDGGTSRFDKSGKMYHSVCAACGGNPYGFTTTPGVYGPKNNASNCNMAVFKFEISFLKTNITDINPTICFPDEIEFDNVTTSGNGIYYWDFGDGTTSNQLNPKHSYAEPGTYTVKFVVEDPENCYVSDTSKFEVTVKVFKANVNAPTDSICPNVGQQLTASGGNSYSWSPAEFLDNPNSPTPIATVSTTTDFMVIVKGQECGVDTIFTKVLVYQDSITISDDTTICIGNSVQLSAHGAVQYTWSPTNFLDNPTIANPIATPNHDITYTVSGISKNGCLLKATTDIFIDHPPQPDIPDSLTVCNGDSYTITVSGATDYYWSPNVEINTTQGNTVTIKPTHSHYYYCDFVNTCGAIRDSVYVTVIKTVVNAWNDTIICYGESVPLFASGARTYIWSPSVTFVDPSGSIVTAKPTGPTIYNVVGTDEYGCKATDNVFVDMYPRPFVQTIPDVYGFYDEEVELGILNEQEGTYIWSPAEYLSCTECTNPMASPNTNFTYTVTYIDENGCKASDQIRVKYEPLLYIPNAFTPDENGVNDVFRIYGVNIDAITLDIYNRWGELIYTLHGMDEYWDGTYKGLPCPIGTYAWKIEYTDIIRDIILTKTGHVNIVR